MHQSGKLTTIIYTHAIQENVPLLFFLLWKYTNFITIFDVKCYKSWI